MSGDDPGRGRLFLVTAAPGPATTDAGDAAAVSPATVGSRLAARSARAVAIDAGVFDGMVVAGRESYAAPHDGRATSEQVRQLLLRWSAALATAETYQLEGFDAVISDHVPGPRLEDFLDLVSPEPVHLVVLGAPDDPAMRETPPWGLRLDPTGRSTEETVDEIVARVAEALVATSDDA